MANKKGTPEGIVKAEIVKTLRGMGVRVFKLPAGSLKVKGGFMQLNAEGTPDLLAMVPVNRSGITRPLWIECKKPKGGVISPEQVVFAREARQRGESHVFAASLQDALDAMATVEV